MPMVHQHYGQTERRLTIAILCFAIRALHGKNGICEGRHTVVDVNWSQVMISVVLWYYRVVETI